jgi:hypothetical protein
MTSTLLIAAAIGCVALSYQLAKRTEDYALAKVQAEQAALAVANVAESYNAQLQLQEHAIRTKEATNAKLSKDLQQALLRIRTAKAEPCFDTAIPSTVSGGLCLSASSLPTGSVLKDSSEFARACTAPITCRDTAEWVAEYTTALEACNEKLRLITAMQESTYAVERR